MSDLRNPSAVYALRRGWFSDPECSLATHRRQGALNILKLWGAEPTFEPHQDHCMLSEKQRFNRCFGYSYSCTCKGRSNDAIWPEWVVDEVLDAAYAAANALQTARGNFHKRQIARAS